MLRAALAKAMQKGGEQPNVKASHSKRLLEFLEATQMTQVLTKDTTNNVKEIPFLSAIEPDSYICFYFASSWCTKSSKITPVLSAIYKQIKADPSKKLEIVYVSYDRDDASFESFFSEMPFLALPRDSVGSSLLSSHFNVDSIPRLAMIGPEGDLVNSNARSALLQFGAAGFPWPDKEASAAQEPISLFWILVIAILAVLVASFCVTTTYTSMKEGLAKKLQL